MEDSVIILPPTLSAEQVCCGHLGTLVPAQGLPAEWVSAACWPGCALSGAHPPRGEPVTCSGSGLPSLLLSEQDPVSQAHASFMRCGHPKAPSVKWANSGVTPPRLLQSEENFEELPCNFT